MEGGVVGHNFGRGPYQPSLVYYGSVSSQEHE
jgi:hypothetical protein